MVASNCSSDWDCPGLLACYKGEPWQLDPAQAECLCSARQGWTNAPECDGLGPQAIWSLVTNGLFLALAVMGAAVCSTALAYVVAQTQKRVSNLVATGGLTVAALLALSAHKAVIIARLLQPQHNDFRWGEYQLKHHRLDPAERALAVTGAVLGVLAMMNLGLAWVEVATSAKRFRRYQSGSFGFYKKVNLAFQLLFLLIVVPCMAVDRPDIATYAAIFFMAFVISTFLLGQRRMLQTIQGLQQGEGRRGGGGGQGGKESAADAGVPGECRCRCYCLPCGSQPPQQHQQRGSRDSQYLAVAHQIRITSLWVVVWLVAWIGVALGYAVMASIGFRTFTPYMELAPITICNEATSFCLILALLGVVWYVVMVYVSKMATGSKNSKSCATTGEAREQQQQEQQPGPNGLGPGQQPEVSPQPPPTSSLGTMASTRASDALNVV